MRSAWQKWSLLGRLFFCLHVLSNILVNKVCCQSNNLFISHQNTINMHPKSFPSPIFISHYVSELINQLVQYQHQPLRFLPDAHHFFSINYRIISVDNNKMTKLPCLLSRPRWSRGNVLASGSKVRGFLNKSQCIGQQWPPHQNNIIQYKYHRIHSVPSYVSHLWRWPLSPARRCR